MAYYCTCNSQCSCHGKTFECKKNSTICQCDANVDTAKGTRSQTPFTYKTAQISSLQGNTYDSAWTSIHSAINAELDIRALSNKKPTWKSNPAGYTIYPDVANQVRQAIIDASGGDVGTVYQYNNVYAYWFNAVVDKIHELQSSEVCTCDTHCICDSYKCGSHCACDDECCHYHCYCECDTTNH